MVDYCGNCKFWIMFVNFNDNFSLFFSVLQNFLLKVYSISSVLKWFKIPQRRTEFDVTDNIKGAPVFGILTQLTQ